MQEDLILTVFIVEDNPTNRIALESLLGANKNYYIQSFESGEKCLEQITANPDVVVLDFFLNSKNTDSLDGLEVLKAIKAYNNDIKVIMLTTNEDLNTAVKCMKNKAYDYIVKNENAFLRLEHIFEKIYINAQRDLEFEIKDSELSFAKFKRKATFWSVIVIIILFLLTEILIEPLIENYANSDLISILLKLSIALLIKPIESFVVFIMKIFTEI